LEGGVGYSLQAAGAEVPGGGNNASVITGSLTYGVGPLYLGVTYEQINCPNNTAAPATGTCSLASKSDQKHLQVGGTFDLKFLKIHALYSDEQDQFAGAAVTNSSDSQAYMVGLTAPLGGGEAKFSYQTRDDKSTANADLRTFAVGYQYPLSRRTAVAAYYSDSDNKNSVAALAPRDRKGYGFGIRHLF
jgi:predicted porin